jgi:hypothetical protein
MSLKESIFDQISCETFEEIGVLNNAALIISFSVGYTDKHGEPYHLDSGAFDVGQKFKLNVPSDAKNIVFTIHKQVVAKVWKVVYTENLEKAQTKCYRVTGHLVSTNCNEITCWKD